MQMMLELIHIYTHDRDDMVQTGSKFYLRLWRFSQPIESSPAKLWVYLLLYPDQHGRHMIDDLGAASERRDAKCFFLM